ncbi:MAG TPA: putative sugar O-methyltransferase, partial [Candidatus Limnocylindria bacterium]|nr:putative sugar O-methyltransferase [Candidatus Limnocylindria bacterium]
MFASGVKRPAVGTAFPVSPEDSMRCLRRTMGNRQTWEQSLRARGREMTDGGKFWEDLAAEHADALEVHGFDSVKRVQALRYFTWRWGMRRALLGHQGRYLLTHSWPSSWLRAALGRVDLSEGAWAPVTWPRGERWLYAIATRLAWDVARRHGSPATLALPEPALGSPFPIHWRGRLISQDLANTALEMRSIEEALDGRRPDHVLELGAGYGRTAYAVLSNYPDASYTIVDIRPAIEISRWYLTALFPNRDITFVDGADADSLARPFDLAISISSLQEMTPEVV